MFHVEQFYVLQISFYGMFVSRSDLYFEIYEAVFWLYGLAKFLLMFHVEHAL